MNKVRLDKVASFYNGRAFKPEEWQNRGLPIIRIQNLTGSSEEINYFDGEYDERNLVRRGDILISWSASLGVYLWQKQDALLNQHIFKVELKDSIQKNYFYHAATHLLNEMKSHVHGSTMQHITKDRFDVLEIPLPRPDEQKRIAAMLDKANRLRRQRRFAQTLSDTFLQSVFIKVFGDPFTNPHGFKEDCLKHILQMTPQNGLYAPAESYCHVKDKSGTEMVHMSDLFYDVVERGHLKRVNLSEKEVKKYNLDQRDLLLARRSLNYEGAAKPCLIPKSNEPLVFESSMIRLRTDASKVIPIYLYYYLSNERARNAHVLKYITRSTISGINQDNLNQINVIIPTMDLQEKFAAIVQKFERIRRQQREATRQAEHLFQTLLYRAFCGQL